MSTTTKNLLTVGEVIAVALLLVFLVGDSAWTNFVIAALALVAAFDVLRRSGQAPSTSDRSHARTLLHGKNAVVPLRIRWTRRDEE